MTRYFGGVLLGTGGLVRAYQGATKAGLDASVLVEQRLGRALTITSDYNAYGKIDYLLREHAVPVSASEFGADVRLDVVIDADLYDSLPTEIANVTSGNALLSWGDYVRYGYDAEKIIIFEKKT